MPKYALIMQTNACRPSEIITSLESAINLDFSLICICGKRLQKDVCENIRNISAKANKVTNIINKADIVPRIFSIQVLIKLEIW